MGWGSIVGGVVGGIGGFFVGGPAGAIGGAAVGANIGGGMDTNQENASIASDNRDWQGYMSGTAHQREVADLRKAGLNPMLSVNAGASTPPGAMATMQNPLQSSAAGILDAVRVEKELRQANSGIQLNDLIGKAQAASALKDVASAKQAEVQTKSLTSQLGAIDKEAQARETQADWDKRLSTYDNVSKRLNQALGIGNSAKDLLMPKIPIGNAPKPWEGQMKDGTKYNKGTGEIIP